MIKTIYAFDEDGNKIAIGTYNVIPNTKVGGTIFYIDSTADGTYTFYNANGQQVQEPTVGTDCTGWSYEVTGATKDKFYVYNNSCMFKRDRTGTQSNPFITWPYLDENNQSYIDNTRHGDKSEIPTGKEEYEYLGYYGRVMETHGSSFNSSSTGKYNTNLIINTRNGVYCQGAQVSYRGESTYAETMWYICDQFNKGTYTLNNVLIPNDTGCSDWYIPSKNELTNMVTFIGDSTFADALYTGDSSSVKINVWTSSFLLNSWGVGYSVYKLAGEEEFHFSNQMQIYPATNEECVVLSRSF